MQPGQAYRLRTQVEHKDVEHPLDSLVAIVLWAPWERTESDSKTRLFNYLVPHQVASGRTDFEAVAVAPEGATAMTVRYMFRWSQRGSSRWTPPQIQPTSVPVKRAGQGLRGERHAADAAADSARSRFPRIWACRRRGQSVDHWAAWSWPPAAASRS